MGKGQELRVGEDTFEMLKYLQWAISEGGKIYDPGIWGRDLVRDKGNVTQYLKSWY